MASIKRLKKDIDYLTFSVVSDSIQYAIVAQGKNQEQLEQLVQNILGTRDELRTKVNEGKRVPKSERANHYKVIFKDLISSVDEAFTELSKMIKE